MKKSIIALAVLATMAAQADNTTLYGSVRMQYLYNDGGEGNSTSSFENAGSRFGIKGSEDLGNGMSAIYKYENRIKGTPATKKLYVGLKGGFGEVTFGKQALPVDSLSNYSDPFNSLGPDSRSDETLGIVGAKTSSDNSAVYWSPDMEGFSVGAAVVADGGTNDNAPDAKHEHADHAQIAAKYEANGIFAGVGYSKNNLTSAYNDNEIDVITLGLGYGNDQFEIGMLADHHRADNDDATWARLSGLYNVTPSDAIYLGASSWFTDFDGIDDAWQGAVGYQHKFSKRTRMWAEYNFAEGFVKDEDGANSLSLGLRTDF